MWLEAGKQVMFHLTTVERNTEKFEIFIREKNKTKNNPKHERLKQKLSIRVIHEIREVPVEKLGLMWEVDETAKKL